MISKDLILLLLADKSRRRRQTQCRRHFLCVSVLGKKKIICISAVVVVVVDPDKGRTTKPSNYLNIRPCLLYEDLHSLTFTRRCLTYVS